MNKKDIRRKFRESVFGRDGGKCVFCGKLAVDAHHITDRNKMPNGGYVKENGISLCEKDHVLVETYHSSEHAWWPVGMHPDDLYAKVKTTYEAALVSSKFIYINWVLCMPISKEDDDLVDKAAARFVSKEKFKPLKKG